MEALPEQIRNEQIKLVYRQAPLILIGSFMAAMLLVISIRNQVPHQHLIIWSLLFISLAIIRAALTWAYWKYHERTDRKSWHWGPMFYIGAGFAGSLWGFASVIFYLPDDPQYILFISFIYAGLVASSGASSGAYMPAYFYFATPATIPFAIRHLMQGGELFIFMGVLSLFYLAICGIFVRTYHKNTALLIRTQIKNKFLLDQVEKEKQVAEHSQKIAEQAVIEKNRFLAAASHDLRQPLHALGLFIGVLRRKTPDSQLQLVESIEDSISALNHLFNGLLDVSRLDAGVVTVVAKHIDLNALLQRLYAEYKSLAAERKLTFGINCENIVVNTDPILLERVLRNLIVNAINYTDEGQVSLRCERVDDVIELNVIDTGIGIPSHETDAIFSEYYQLNNPERDRNKGLGLGLAIVRRLCDLMQIPLAVESAQGRGTKFSLRIKPGDANLIDQKTPVFDLSNMSDFSILVIDDEKSVLHGMEGILTTWGSKVLLAESADEAVRLIAEQNFNPDIIFSDYRLRNNKTGVEAISAVCDELNSDIPAIIITGDTSPERLKEASSSGFHLLHKPVTPDALRQVLLSIGSVSQ